MFEPKENAITYYVKVGSYSESFANACEVLMYLDKHGRGMSQRWNLLYEAEVKCITLGGAMWRLQVREKEGGALDLQTNWVEVKGGEL
jgi:hypothetical protein